MKKLLLIAVSLLAAVSTYAQGSLNFNTHQVAKGIDAPVTFNGTKVSGPSFVGQLFVGASGSAEGSLVAAGSPAPFLTGAGAGYIIQSAQVVANNVAPGAAATVQMRAWDSTTGASYDAAAVRGKSTLFNLAALGGSGTPPTLPADLTGLTAFSVTGTVPEPSTIALAALGGAAALFLRRRK